MCKPTCCPAPGGNGLATPALIAGALAVTAILAGPIAAAVASLLHALVLIVIITAATVAGITVLAVTVVIYRRTRRPHQPDRPPITIAARAQRAQPMALVQPPALPSRTASFELTPAERARCEAPGTDPGQVAHLIAAVLGGGPQ